MVVALAYILAIVYASLQPFSGWRMPPAEVIGFLRAPWPRYITSSDIALNIAAYLPLGAMLFTALRPRRSPVAAWLAATLAGSLLSLSMESIQMFLPTRIASNVDLLTNSAGTCVGALAAWFALLPAHNSNPLRALRQRMFRGGVSVDLGLLLIALWIVIQFHPVPLTFTSGDLREAFELAPRFAYTPQSYFLAEITVVALATLAIGLVVSLVLAPGQRPLLSALAVLVLALAARAAADAMMVHSAHLLQWLTPGTGLGLATGVVVLALSVRLPRITRVVTAVLCLAAGIVVVNVSPVNPYLAVPPFMLGPQQSHLVNFNHVLHVLSGMWPWLTAACVIALGRGDRDHSEH